MVTRAEYLLYRQNSARRGNRYDSDNCQEVDFPLARAEWIGRQASMWTSFEKNSEIAEYWDQQLEDNDELSSVELQRLVVRKFAVEISPPTIRRYLRTSLQWTVVRMRFGPMISEKNRSKCMEFARMSIDTNDVLDNVIWTDESSVQLRRHSQTMRVKIGKERQLKPQAKHTLKVHVWAGISNRGATKICIFDQTMDATLYIEILRNFLLPFIEKKFQGFGDRFMQDNDPKHTSKKAKEFYEQKGINWWPTPASSADINPIERVRRELKILPCSACKAFVKERTGKGNLPLLERKDDVSKVC